MNPTPLQSRELCTSGVVLYFDCIQDCYVYGSALTRRSIMNDIGYWDERPCVIRYPGPLVPMFRQWTGQDQVHDPRSRFVEEKQSTEYFCLKMDLLERLAIGVSLAEEISTYHESGLIHGNVGPTTTMLSGTDVVLLPPSYGDIVWPIDPNSELRPYEDFYQYGRMLDRLLPNFEIGRKIMQYPHIICLEKISLLLSSLVDTKGKQ